MNDTPPPTPDLKSLAKGAHARPCEAVMAAAGATPDGLSGHEAARRLAEVGPNQVSAVLRRSALAAFLAQFNNVLIYVLIAAAAVTAALGHMIDTGVILAVVIINALIGFVQERRAERSLDAIRGLIALKATVLRERRRLSIPAEDVVPGDIVMLEAGDKVPADLRMVRSRGLQIQEAILTGESLPVDKRVDAVAEDAPLGDRASLAFAGTIVSRGRGRGLVVATGNRTELGRISDLIGKVETPETPLTRQLAGLGRTVTWAILALSAAVFAWGYFVNRSPLDELFFVAVGIAVAAIPEGLPAIVTITLAIGVERMARRRAIVRHLPAVETLGSVGVVCSDKTGTFTRNEMVVEEIATGAALYRVTGSGYRPEGEIRLGEDTLADLPHDVLRLAEGASHCNDALLRKSDDDWHVDGDPMEGALLAFAAKAGFDHTGETRRPRLDEIPFDPEHRFMATLHSTDGDTVVYVKGAPERVIAMCDRALAANGSETDIDALYWEAQVERMTGDGMRVLAVAELPEAGDIANLAVPDVEGELVLTGLLGLMDPPRDEAIDAVARCRSAGIRVKMITGDHVGTASAIAGKLGFERPEAVLSGADLDRLDPAAFTATARDTDVFARTSPDHKLRLVEALQSDGGVIAMTGDGVNDAPALKRADVGVAMGKRGADAAKEAAEIVLADDNFATIAAAVEEGRQAYDNLRKSIAFILPTNAGQAFVLVAAVLFGLVGPITPVQILWVNLVTAITLALALAFESAESDLMRRPPRNPAAAILSRFIVWRIGMVAAFIVAGVFGIFYWLIEGGADIAYARTAAVNTVVAFEIVYLLSVRRLRDPGWTGLLAARPIWIAIALVVLFQIAFTYVPLMNLLFGTAPLALGTWLVIVPVSATIFVVSEWEKVIVGRRRARRNGAR